jgi:tRNA threonylcarbamoyladenosine biosynthesis protein TsaB
MLILAINTAEAACDVALVRGDTVLAEQREALVRGQDGRLPGLVDEVLLSAGANLGDLDRLAVVTGPGSFTGIRIGVSFVRGLALALGIPAIGVTSLEAGLPPEMIGPARAALPAQKRPPDRTWWTQELQEGLGVTPVVETPETALDPRDIETATPRAAWAGLKAVALTPAERPAAPVYARAPEIHKAKPKKQNG